MDALKTGSMRRKDREITDFSEIICVIRTSDVIRLGLFDGEETYIVPLNFGFSEEDGKLRFFMHSAKAGRKIDILRKNPKVSFELDRGHELFRRGGYCTMAFESVMGVGSVRFIEDDEGRMAALRALMGHFYEDTSFDLTYFPNTAVLCLEVERISGKRLTLPEPSAE